MILSIISVFVVFFFLPLLNGVGLVRNSTGSITETGFISVSARDIIEDVYPIILVLIPLFTFIGGMVVTVLVVSNTSKSG